MNVEGRKVLVVGLGRSGLAAVRFLVRRGAVVTAADTRPRRHLDAAAAELAELPVQLRFGGHPDGLFLDHELVIPSPGVPWDLPALVAARQRGTLVCGELELAATELQGRVIGVTGTNGKTTTVSLIDHALRASGIPGFVAGNIGTPVLGIVDESRPEHWQVLELSSFQLEAARSFRCHVAVVLNITPDHLDRHRSFRAYVAAKARILRNQKGGDFTVLNGDDPACRELEHRAAGSVLRFGLRCREGLDACVRDGRIAVGDAAICDAGLPIKGPHNLENALAAATACSLAGLGPLAIGSALQSFQPVPHRMEFVGKVRGINFYNDSKATNVAAAVKACGTFPSGLWPILGGRDKGSDYAPLARTLRARARAALLVGEAAPLIRRQLGEAVRTVEAGTIRAALQYAVSNARSGDTVLLAPACASFDQYPNYVERGLEFRKLVAEMGA